MSEHFNELFDHWSANYDDTVSGRDVEYKEVFKYYDDILQNIADRAFGSVLEFGVGTGNLTKKLLENGLDVLGIEPSDKMREIAQQKIHDISIHKGHFLAFPQMDKKVDTIVSSYAFHHLTDDEKEQAIQIFDSLLTKGGKIIFGDTIFESEQAKEDAYFQAKNQEYHRLAEDLSTEYYSTIPILGNMLKKYQFTVDFEKMNDFVWIMEAKKEDMNHDRIK
ncbi:MAG TPA: class I SAM-dependent methyltransferase [Candidatus Avamphibacillus sp.]|nr:class I SAM-dependent methyltransferase [Candidatus Avamphibacillus sp.]